MDQEIEEIEEKEEECINELNYTLLAPPHREEETVLEEPVIASARALL